MESNKELITELNMEQIREMPRGEVYNFNTAHTDRTGSLKMVITDALGIVDGTMITNRVTKSLQHYNDMPLVEMNFMLEGNIRQTNEGLLHKHNYLRGYHNILFNPYSYETNEFMNSGAHHIFSVHMLPERMAALLHGYLPELEAYSEKIMQGKSFVLHTPMNGIDNQLKYFFDTFWDSPQQTGLRKLYFDSKVMDLLGRQCALLLGTAPNNNSISQAELEKIYHAKEVLAENLDNPPTLKELAVLCSLNEFKLKKYFKAVFQNTIYGFVCEERLNRAKQMIYEGEKNISSIAYELGYAHPQHFHRAFKKQFGVTPKSLLK